MKLWFLAALALFFAPRCFGFCFQPVPSVVCEFLNSDAVFVGRVISIQAAPPWSEELDGSLYTLSVEELFRGPNSGKISVYRENSSGRYTLEVGKEYLIFATQNLGRFEIGSCGNDVPLSQAMATIQRLRKLQVPDDALIEGGISFSGVPDQRPRAAGIQIRFRSGRKRFVALTDADGHFELHVPPGAYAATVQEIPAWKISPFDLSVDKPERFTARAGHCTGLQFVANPN
jgi:hypothetical protein